MEKLYDAENAVLATHAKAVAAIIKAELVNEPADDIEIAIDENLLQVMCDLEIAIRLELDK